MNLLFIFAIILGFAFVESVPVSADSTTADGEF